MMRKILIDIKTSEETKVDITPMLDIVFIMLIFFIVTATFVNETGFNLTPATSQNENSVNTKDNIFIQIKEDDKIFINFKNIDIHRLNANIQHHITQNPEAKVVIQAIKASKNNTLVQVIDTVREAGIYSYSLAPSSE